MRVLLTLSICILGAFVFLRSFSVHAEEQNKKTQVILRIDDFGQDNYLLYPEILKIVHEASAKISIGIIPAKFSGKTITYLDTSKINYLKKVSSNCKCIELAMHGYTHQTFSETGIASEFYDRDIISQQTALRAGKKYLDQMFQSNVKVFIPPFNSFDHHTTDILVDLGLTAISAASYGQVDIKNLNSNLAYIPYTIQLTKAVSSDLNHFISERGGVVVILFHTYDFLEDHKENSTRYGNMSKKISLLEFREFLLKLKNNDKIVFSSFEELAKILNKEFSSRRYVNSFISGPILPVYPDISKESIFYIEENEINLKNIYFVIYPFFFYLIIVSFGFFIFKISKRILRIHRYKFFLNFFILLLVSFSLIFWRENLKYVVAAFLLYGYTLGFFADRIKE